jgi:hypothetical protein
MAPNRKDTAQALVQVAAELHRLGVAMNGPNVTPATVSATYRDDFDGPLPAGVVWSDEVTA